MLGDVHIHNYFSILYFSTFIYLPRTLWIFLKKSLVVFFSLVQATFCQRWTMNQNFPVLSLFNVTYFWFNNLLLLFIVKPDASLVLLRRRAAAGQTTLGKEKVNELRVRYLSRIEPNINSLCVITNGMIRWIYLVTAYIAANSVHDSRNTTKLALWSPESAKRKGSSVGL